jgi:sulfite exporter TauE/SafE
MDPVFHLVSMCRAGLELFEQQPGGIAVTLFLAGLAGSVTHCTGMCGPFVIGQVMVDAGRIATGYGEWRRFGAALFVPYHAGRTVTYAVLGGVAGASTFVFASTDFFAGLSAVLLVCGATLMLAQAIGLAARIPAPQENLVRRLAAPLIASRSHFARFVLGMVLGLLPCGLIYGALGVAAGTGSPVRGALAMAAFAAGTVPALVAVAWGGMLLRRRYENVMRWVAVPLLAFNAALMVALAGARF